jgi:hypothetical protein
MRRPVLLGLALSLVLSACGGPKPSLTFGGKAVPVNVSFGKPGADGPKQAYVLAPVPAGLGVVPVAGKVFRPTLPTSLPDTPPPAACPPANPADVEDQPKAEAGRDFAGPPKAGALPFSVKGKYVSAANTVNFDGFMTRVVLDPAVDANGRITFAVRSLALDVDTTATYVSTQANASSVVEVPGEIGLKSVTAKGKGIDGTPSFSAPDPVTLMRMRPNPGVTWNDGTVDPLTGTTFRVAGTVAGKDRVDACGQFVDAWRVALSQDVTTPLEQIHSEITYWFATQYGGLVVKEAVSWSGMAGLTKVSGDYVATVMKDPGL